MANPAQKPKRVGQQLEPNILGSSIYETKRYWVPVSTNILGSSIYETSAGYQQRYSQKSKRVGESILLWKFIAKHVKCDQDIFKWKSSIDFKRLPQSVVVEAIVLSETWVGEANCDVKRMIGSADIWKIKNHSQYNPQTEQKAKQYMPQQWWKAALGHSHLQSCHSSFFLFQRF